MSPELPGYCSSAPNTAAGSRSFERIADFDAQPSGSARVRTTAIVCGWHSASTKNAFVCDFATRRAIAMASAAAVASSSNEAFAMSSEQSSQIIVWKFNRASSRPWLISGW